MYRTYEDILDAMIKGNTKPSNATRYIYNYKKSHKFELAAMWFRAKIEYEEKYARDIRE